MNNFEKIKNFSFEEMSCFLKKIENGELGDEFCAEVCERRNSKEDCDCPYLDDNYIDAYLKAEAEVNQGSRKAPTDVHLLGKRRNSE